MTAKRTTIGALLLVVQSLLFALLAGYLLQNETISNVQIAKFAVLLTLFSSVGMWIAIRAKEKANSPVSALFRITLVILGSTVACWLLAETTFGSGGSKKIGIFPVVVAIPIVLAFSSTSPRKQVSLVANDI